MVQELILEEHHTQRRLYVKYNDLLALFGCDSRDMRRTNH